MSFPFPNISVSSSFPFIHILYYCSWSLYIFWFPLYSFHITYLVFHLPIASSLLHDLFIHPWLPLLSVYIDCRVCIHRQMYTATSLSLALIPLLIIHLCIQLTQTSHLHAPSVIQTQCILNWTSALRFPASGMVPPASQLPAYHPDAPLFSPPSNITWCSVNSTS